MRSGFHVARGLAVTALLALALAAGGCRQANGPVPEPNASRQDDLKDVAKDLLNIKAKDPSASKDLQDDLVRFNDKPTVVAATRELANRVSTAVAGSKLSETEAGELGHQLWVTIAAAQLSTSQAKGIRDDVEMILKNAGANKDAINAVGEQIITTQAAATTNRRKWYEFF